MADNLDIALAKLSEYLSNESVIELYRANFATPESLEALRFWCQGELSQIQLAFSSTEETIADITQALVDVISVIDASGGQGEQGDKGDKGDPGEDGQDGQDGQDGDAGDLINDGVTSLALTWSSQKIQDELDNKAGVSDLAHGLYSERHNDILLGSPPQSRELLAQRAGGGAFTLETRVNWRGQYAAGTYYKHDQVAQGSSLFIANIETTTAPPSVDWDLVVQSSATQEFVAGETIPAGSIGALIGSEIFLADASVLARANGFLVTPDEEVLVGNTGTFTVRGVSINLSVATSDGPYYLRNNGLISTNPPTGPSDMVRIVGHRQSTGNLYFSPDETWMELSTNTLVGELAVQKINGVDLFITTPAETGFLVTGDIDNLVTGDDDFLIVGEN